MSRQHAQADVVILGSGLAGSIAALCLRRQGLTVVLIDQGTHPRFALGESTTTPSSLWLRILAARFQAPELLHIASAEAITRHVAPTSGVKNNFGFLYHRAGQAAPERAWQAIIPQAFLAENEFEKQAPHNEMHYFRQDIDAWLWSTALAAGASPRPATTVDRVEFDDDGVIVGTTAGETIRGRFLIDASGYRSPVARRLDLRDPVPRMRTDSRSLFTHMVGVRPFESTKSVPDSMALWSQGTLHHFFDGGWVWVIPFDNHRDSTNPLCSVGLNIDNRRFPKPPGMSAAEEWAAFLDAHPVIGRQFADAVAVRPWVDTGRVQYTSRNCVGARYWLTSHAAATVDALYSIGNINTFQTLATGIALIVRACREDVFRRERMQPLQDLTEALFRFQDRLVYGNYVAFRDPRLLSTWIALWSLTDTARIRRILPALVRYVRTDDLGAFDFIEQDPATILTGMGMITGVTDTATVLDQLDALCDIMQELEEGRASADATVQRLEQAVQALPHYRIDLKGIEAAFARQPWAYEPLARHGIRAHCTVFLSPREMNTIGLEERC